MYKNGNISSKFIGINHYRRYFNFTDKIPNIEELFDNYDIILSEPVNLNLTMIQQYCQNHICEAYNEILNIIKEIKPEYYKTALKSSEEKTIYSCNLFIMKKKDFFKFCEFIFDVLFEFDRRKNFTSDEDVLNYTKSIFKNSSDYYYQSRLEAFLSERMSNIFFRHHFKRIKTFSVGNYNTSKYSLFKPNIIFRKKINLEKFTYFIQYNKKKFILLLMIIFISYFNCFFLNVY